MVANTATLPVPPTPIETFPPELTIVTFDVPLLRLDTVVDRLGILTTPVLPLIEIALLGVPPTFAPITKLPLEV